MLQVYTVLPCTLQWHWLWSSPAGAVLQTTCLVIDEAAAEDLYMCDLSICIREHIFQGFHFRISEWWGLKPRELQQPVLDQSQQKWARVSTLTCREAFSGPVTEPCVGPLSPQWSDSFVGGNSWVPATQRDLTCWHLQLSNAVWVRLRARRTQAKRNNQRSRNRTIHSEFNQVWEHHLNSTHLCNKLQSIDD